MTAPHPDITYNFPPGFLWGTATSSHQVEGHNLNNDWWAFEQYAIQHNTGELHANQASGAACNWWEGDCALADIELMAGLGANAHRISVEWSRIEPQQGQWDQAAIDQYREWLVAMLARGIKPMLTLFHFTVPLWMAEQGGWLNPHSIGHFKRFAQKMAAEFGDLVDQWCTVNEPNVYAMQGFVKGFSPPKKHSLRDYFTVLFNVMHAHAVAYEAIHEIQPHAQVGFAKHLVWWQPRLALSPLDQAAFEFLKHNFNSITLELLQTGRWTPPPFFGKRGYFPKFKHTLDWVGINYYHRYDVGVNLRSRDPYNFVFMGRHGLEKGPEWWGELWPDGLYFHLQKLHQRYRLPIYITENGVPDPTDDHRPHFILDHLRRVWQAIRNGIDVRGYYHWSLIDNFEWLEAYNPAFFFGLYAVDFETQARTARGSANLYREIAQSNSISSRMARQYAPESLDVLLPERTSLLQVTRHALMTGEYDEDVHMHD
jgi:beta-glucosidase